MSASDPEAPFRQTGWPGLRARLFHLFFLIRRPVTLGVRAVIHDRDAGTVLLIRHTYVPGWQLPGGGVEIGETSAEALARELREECEIALTAPATLRSVYFNRLSSRRDHVLFYLVSDFRVLAPKRPDREIAEAGFFQLDNLPDHTTPATRRRLAEMFDGAAMSAYW
jgi:8-oxo-dGTP pyrophosphatase MutT (NUDIX family)